MGHYVQMVAAFLVLSLSHYFTAAFLPNADCFETFNFVEPLHYILFGSGMQTWETCAQYALRSWLFVWVYAWPAAFIRGATTLSSVDVYFYLRIFNGRIACLCELFFVYSVWAAFSGRAAVVALLLLIFNYPIPHAAVSMLPTSYAMCCYFVALGCWMRTGSETAGAVAAPRRTATLFFVGATIVLTVAACMVGWPFAGLIAVPTGLDLFCRFPRHTIIFLVGSVGTMGALTFAVDSWYYCRPVLSTWNLIAYNGLGGAQDGHELYGVEPWFYFPKNLLLNFHLTFLASLAGPLVLLLKQGRAVGVGSPGVSRGRQLLYMAPFFLWLTLWLGIAHKKEHFMAPAYPFLTFAVTIAITQVCFPRNCLGGSRLSRPLLYTRPSSPNSQRPPSPTKTRGMTRCLFVMGCLFLTACGVVSFSRALAVYHFYGGPQRLFYDVYRRLAKEAAQHEALQMAAQPATGSRPYTVCVGNEWHRFPSSFFIPHAHMRYAFINVGAVHGILPVPFRSPAGAAQGLLSQHKAPQDQERSNTAPPYGTCGCGAEEVNGLHAEIAAQYVRDIRTECDVIFDSLSDLESTTEREVLQLSHFPRSLRPVHAEPSQLKNYYDVLDVDRTPLWCRVLYYPLGLSQRCATWRPVVLQARERVEWLETR